MKSGFEASEYQTRVSRAQVQMNHHKLDALLLTTEPEIRYFTGFLTQFWESPCRPWFLIVTASGLPIAIIPSIGEVLMARTWISDIRTWNAPNLVDDGINLLLEALLSIGPNIGTPSGMQSQLRMPLVDFARLNAALKSPIRTDEGIMQRLRMVKSNAEVAKIKNACDIAGRAFERVPEIAQSGVPLKRIFRDFQRLCLDEGADWVPYLAGAAAPNGYGDIISPADDHRLCQGDVLMLDTGLVSDGYFCDYDRNFVVGSVPNEVDSAHRKLIDAIEAAFGIARPGNTTADLFNIMDKFINNGKSSTNMGRYGHGLGMNLTEWPSLIPSDQTLLAEGMVLTLEPNIEVRPGVTLVAEENIVIRESGAEWLSKPSKSKMPRLK